VIGATDTGEEWGIQLQASYCRPAMELRRHVQVPWRSTWVAVFCPIVTPVQQVPLVRRESLDLSFYVHRVGLPGRPTLSA
jgi:hypothetical protein